MKKTSRISQIDEKYQIVTLFNSIAEVKNSEGETGLIDINTGCVISSFNHFNTTYVNNIIIQNLEDTIWYRFCDSCSAQLISDDAILEWHNKKENIYIVQDGKTRKHRLIDLKNYNGLGNISRELFDSIDFIYEENGISYFKVVAGSNTYLYSSVNGLVECESFDEFHKYGCAKIFHRRNKETNQMEYILEHPRGTSVIREKVDSYQVEGNCLSFICCKKGDSIYIYMVGNTAFNEIAIVPSCESIHLKNSEIIKQAGSFIMEDGGKKGLLFFDLKDHIKRIVPIEYDDIEAATDELIYYLIKGDKKGICGLYKKNFYHIDALYDELKKTKETVYVSKDSRNTLVSATMFFSHESIEPINSDYCIVCKDGKKGIASRLDANGIIGYNKVIIPVEYDDITFKEKDGLLFFILKNEGSCKLAVNSYMNRLLDKMEGDSYLEIVFLEDIIVKRSIKTGDLFLYNYDDCLLKILTGTSKIHEVSKDMVDLPSSDIKSVYLINGEIYYFMNNRLVKLPDKLYMTAYEGEFGTVVVNDIDKEKHDAKCAAIEQIPEEELEATLKEHFKSSPELQEQYPTLTLKLDK